MDRHDIWIIRTVLARLRQPGMHVQRRFVAIVAIVLSGYVVAATYYLFQQPTPDAMEAAALKIFGGMGILIALAIGAAVVVRKRTGATWPGEHTLPPARRTPGLQPPANSNRRE